MENIKKYILDNLKKGNAVGISGYIDDEGTTFSCYSVEGLIVTNMKVSKTHNSYSINFKGNELMFDQLEINKIYNMLYNLSSKENYELYGIVEGNKSNETFVNKESGEIMTGEVVKKTRKTKKNVATE